MFQLRIAAALMCGLILSGCGQSATNTPAPPAPVAPTQADAAAAVQPSATLPPPTVAPTTAPVENAGEELRAGFVKAEAQTHYNFSLSFGSMASGGALNLTNYNATINGEDFAVTNTSADASTQPFTVTIRRVAGLTYARGPLPIQQETQPVWYTLGPNQALANSPIAMSEVFRALPSRVDLSQMTLVGEETQDALMCRRYRGDLAIALGFVDALGTPTTPEAAAAEATPVVERMQAQGFDFGAAEANVLLCDDGIVHEVTSRVEAKIPNMSDPVIMFLTVTLSEIGGEFAIPVPFEPVEVGQIVPMAEVINGGNVREKPSIEGNVVDQVNAYEQVRLVRRNADSTWYQIVNPRDMVGWVSASLLQVDGSAAAQLPVGE